MSLRKQHCITAAISHTQSYWKFATFSSLVNVRTSPIKCKVVKPAVWSCRKTTKSETFDLENEGSKPSVSQRKFYGLARFGGLRTHAEMMFPFWRKTSKSK